MGSHPAGWGGHLRKEAAPGSAPRCALKGDVRGSMGSFWQAEGRGVCPVFVDMEPWLGGVRDTPEQQDGGRWRWEIPITDTLTWTPGTWARPDPSAPSERRSDRSGLGSAGRTGTMSLHLSWLSQHLQLHGSAPSHPARCWSPPHRCPQLKTCLLGPADGLQWPRDPSALRVSGAEPCTADAPFPTATQMPTGL